MPARARQRGQSLDTGPILLAEIGGEAADPPGWERFARRSGRGFLAHETAQLGPDPEPHEPEAFRARRSISRRPSLY